MRPNGFPTLSSLGQVYSLGRAEYGRLGLGEGAEEKSEPVPVMGMEPAKRVTCGASVSYAVTREGVKQSKYSRGDSVTTNINYEKWDN